MQAKRANFLVFGWIRINIEDIQTIIPNSLKDLCCKFYPKLEFIQFESFAKSCTKIKSNEKGIHTHKTAKLSNKTNSLNKTNSFIDQRVLISKIGGWQKGVHEWKIKLLIKHGEMGIGVCCPHEYQYDIKNDKHIDAVINYDFDKKLNIANSTWLFANQLRYCYYWHSRSANSQTKYKESDIYSYSRGSKYGETQKPKLMYAEKDIVTVRLDCDNWKLYWLINQYNENNHSYNDGDILLENKIDLVPFMYYYPVICSAEKNDSSQVLC